MSHRFRVVMLAGTVDSLCLSMAWTVVIVTVTARHGLAASGTCSAAMMLGIAMSAPVATWWSQRLEGRRLLRSAAAVEAALRLTVFLLLFADAAVWLLATAVCVMNVVAWTGYAGMRAEVAAARPGSASLTWYGTMVAAVEATGVALVAWLPDVDRPGVHPLQLAILAVYLLALVPTAVVAGGSKVPRAERAESSGSSPVSRRLVPSGAVAMGTLLMFMASAPTLLSVALTAELHGRAAIAPAAIAFTVGSLAAPAMNGWLEARRLNRPVTWLVCAMGMTALWVAAPASLVMLCLAQVSAGLCMTALEGLLDATVARQNPSAVTGALARATAARALGSAAGAATLPLAVVAVGLGYTTGSVTAVLALVAIVTVLAGRRRAGVVVEGEKPVAVPVTSMTAGRTAA